MNFARGPSRRHFAAAVALSLSITAGAGRAWSDPIDPRVSLLERDATHARVWWWGFTLTYSAVAVGQTVLAIAAEDPGLRIDSAVGAAATWLGVGGMLLSPIPTVWRAAADARRTGQIEESFARAVAAESNARAWYNHLACAVVAVASGAVLWIGYDRLESGVLNFASNLVVGELNLFTQPARALHHRDHPVARWSLVPTLHGVQFVGVW